MTNNGVRECFVGFIKDVTVQKSLMIAKAEQEASEELLHNILPEHIAHRLKQVQPEGLLSPSHIADHYENTTILFADIVGFTDRANRMSPHDGASPFAISCFVVGFSLADLLTAHPVFRSRHNAQRPLRPI